MNADAKIQRKEFIEAITHQETYTRKVTQAILYSNRLAATIKTNSRTDRLDEQNINLRPKSRKKSV